MRGGLDAGQVVKMLTYLEPRDERLHLPDRRVVRRDGACTAACPPTTRSSRHGPVVSATWRWRCRPSRWGSSSRWQAWPSCASSSKYTLKVEKVIYSNIAQILATQIARQPPDGQPDRQTRTRSSTRRTPTCSSRTPARSDWCLSRRRSSATSSAWGQEAQDPRRVRHGQAGDGPHQAGRPERSRQFSFAGRCMRRRARPSAQRSRASMRSTSARSTRSMIRRTPSSWS